MLMVSTPALEAGLTASGGGGRDHSACPQCLSSEQDLEMAKRAADLPFVPPSAMSAPSVESAEVIELFRYPFFPHAGIFDGDLFLTNFTDLDATSGFRDPHCGRVTYNGHRGIDTDVLTWSTQLAGVPVFAALGGVVTVAHDGEDDMNTFWANQPANLVYIDHGGGHETRYLHFKKNSVSVAVGQRVEAGEQIGLVGSSGISTGPHLHFETRYNGVTIEPFTGTCRPGESLWMNQPSLAPAPYLREFSIVAQSLSGWSGPPADTASTGTFQVGGVRTIRFWINLLNMTPGMTSRVRFVRPDGSTAYLSSTGSFPSDYRWSWWWWSYEINLNQSGTWYLDFMLNGSLAVRAPFTVKSGPTLNRAPYAQNFTFGDAGVSPDHVPVCRAVRFTVIDDPDYDLVKFRYRWKVNGSVRRDVTTAAWSDALPRGQVSPGDSLVCEVTPTDGSLNGPVSIVSTVVYQPFDDWATAFSIAPGAYDLDTDGDRLPAGLEYLIGLRPDRADPPPAFSFTGDRRIFWSITRSATSDPRPAISVEASGNLQDDWVPWAAEPDPLISPQSGDGRLFARLRVVRPPEVAPAVPVSMVLSP